MEAWESSDSGQELFPVLFHAMRFTSCGGTETHNGREKTRGWTTRTAGGGGARRHGGATLTWEKKISKIGEK